VLKTMIKFRYKFHLYLQMHNEALMRDALCKKLREQLQQRAAYHGSQAIFLVSKI